MSKKLQEISELFADTKSDIVRSIENWQDYLGTGSRLYKYSFDDQLLIHAQKPGATACATMDMWNNKMHRWIKQGSKGIALIKQNAGQKPRLEYVFDLSDTREIEGAKRPYLWSMKDEFIQPITEKFTEMYGEVPVSNFPDTLMEFCERAVGENYREFLHDLSYDLEDSFLEGLDDINIDVTFKNALTASVQYMVLKRCDIDPSLYLEDDDFRLVMQFNTGEVLSHLGNALNVVSSEMLINIGNIARKIDLEIYKKSIENAKDIDYNKSTEFNTLKRQRNNLQEDINYEQQSNLSNQRGLSNTELNTGRGTGQSAGHSGQIWTSEGNTPQDSPQGNVQPNVARRDVVATFGGSGQHSTGTSGYDNGKNDEVTRGDGGTESERPVTLGAESDEHQGTSRGSSVSGTDLRIDENEKLAEFISTDNAEEQLTALLSYDMHFKNKLEDISAYFSANFSDKDRGEYLKNSFNNDYTLILYNDERLGYKADENGLTIWQGNYLSRKTESTLSWQATAGLMNNLVLPTFRAKQKEQTQQLSLFPTVEQQIENIVNAKTEEQSSVYSFAQSTFYDDETISFDVVDKILTAGSEQLPKNDLPVIAGYMAFENDVEKNAKFLQNHYGTGGKGFEIDGQKYSFWFDKNGVQLGVGDSAIYSANKITLTWEQTAERIRDLLESGSYVSAEILKSSKDSYLDYVATDFAFMYRDRDDDYKNELLDTIKGYGGIKNYSDGVKEYLKTPNGHENIMKALEQMVQDDKNADEGVMRMRWYTPAKTLEVMRTVGSEPVTFPTTKDDFVKTEPTFMTQDEIDNLIIGSDNYVSEHRIDIFLYLSKGFDNKSKADFLKNKNGIGGGGRYGLNTSHNAKGYEIKRGNIFTPYDKYLFNWGQMAKKIDKYIAENRYLSQKDIDFIPQYEREKLSTHIVSFYRYAPKDLENIFEMEFSSDYWSDVKAIANKLDDEGVVDRLLEQMEYALNHTLSDEKGFEAMQKAHDNVLAYKNGTYEVYKTNAFARSSVIDDDVETKATSETVDIKKLARKLESKRSTDLASDEYGQLTLDFSNPVTSILEEEQGLAVSDELIEFAKETLPDNATNKEIADKVVEIIAEDEKNVVPPVCTIMYSEFASEFVKTSSDFADKEMNVYSDDDGKEFVLGYGELGNGTTVWNFFEMKNNDYNIVAHISEDGTVKIYDETMPPLAVQEVEERAKVFYPQKQTEITDISDKTPTELYREYLPIVANKLSVTLAHHYLNQHKPTKEIALEEISLQIERNIDSFAKDSPAFLKAYKELPLFKQFFNEDVYYQKYHNRTHDLIEVNQHNNDLPTWIITKETQQATLERQEKLVQGEQSVLQFLQEKAENPNHIIGVQAGELLLFYGEDAKIVAPAIGSKLLQRDIPELGYKDVTGTKVSNWQIASDKLALKGIDFRLLGEENGQYHLIKEHNASEFMPIGMEIDIDGRKYAIELVDYSADKVTLRDMSFEQNNSYPIFRSENVAYVRSFVEDKQNKDFDLLVQQAESEQSVNHLLEVAEEMARQSTTPDILFFNDFKDIEGSLDYSLYKDQDVIGYNKDGVKYTVGKSGNLVYTTTTTAITPYGEVLGDRMTPEVFEQFKLWKDGESTKISEDVDLEFDGGAINEGETLAPVQVEDTSPKINFTITNNDLGKGGAKEKYNRNVAAIETLKTLEVENRRATPEEQEILSNYVGWGGLPDAFDSEKTAWTKEYAQLNELLTEDEYTSARQSTVNAHYTSPTVIRAMYNALENMDIPKGNVLEPAMGTGNFFGMMPETMATSKLYGVELDSITGRIAKQLYQNANIQVKGYEKTNFPDNFFDMAVGNVPFGGFPVADKKYDKHKFLIHDYFFAKTLDKVRTGGIVAFITSKGTMDKQSTEVRKYLANKADLLGAIRLPNTAFKSNAGTEVTSDILFFQKRDHAPEVMPSWVNLGETENGIAVNKYFEENPQMILGTMENINNMYGFEPACLPNTDTTLEEQLSEAIKHIAMPDKSLLKNEIIDEKNNKIETIEATPDVRNFSYTILENDVYYRENSRMYKVNLSDNETVRLKDLVAIRDITREIIDLQLNECSDDELKTAQDTLNTLFDKYNKKHGLINGKASKKTFYNDVSYPLLCSLEKIDEEGNLVGKADMFSKRTIKNSVKVTSVDTPSEALAVSISEKACVDIEFMANLLGGSDKIPEVIEGLKGIIFKDPLTFHEDNLVGWQTADEYLSGNVRHKLALAKGIAENHPEFAVNVEMLEKVQPKELTASEIDVRIGATWIDPKYYSQFMFELLDTPRYSQGSKIEINYSKHSGEWNVQGKSEDRANPKAFATYGTKRKNAYQIIEDSLNLRDTRVFDTVTDDEGREKRVLNGKETTLAQQKQEAIAEQFKEWLWKSPERREVLAQKYNQIYNSTRPREFDGQHIKFDGMSPLIKLNTHQSNAVARTLYGGNSLLAHCVGAGKTFTMIASAMEGKRLGLQQKSLFVVPNHLTEQMGSDIYQLYPGAKVLVATKKDFEPLNRKQFCSRIATGDFDIVVIGHSQFEKIPLSVARQEAYLEEQIKDIELAITEAKGQDGSRYTVKQLENTKIKLRARLERLSATERKDNVVTYEELGVDKLYVDEAHLFKNLFLHTKMRNVAGIGQSEAQKSTDMFTKCRYMDELTGGKGTVFATGTPVSNSMTELYTMMRYLQYHSLEQLDLTHFDSWAANFGEKVTAIELAPEGTGFRSKTRFAKFFNLPELINIWKEAADIQTADMLNLPVPKAEHTTVVTKPSDFQRDMVTDLAERADLVRRREVEPNVDNMLKITSDGRKLALDQRLNNDLLADNEDSKINKCVDNVFGIWEDTADTKGTQIIFCDLSTPHYDGTFNVYDDIKNKLMEKGIPADEIKFIHDANTELQKADLFAKVRKGTVRVLIGSTAKCGAGTNIQTKLVALHHTDCPWRPADLEQREGRIVRQGNENETVKIFKYVTENTFDAYNWAVIENKQKFIGQIFTSKSPARSADDVDATALSYAEVKALATGDERIKEKMDLDIQVAKLKLMRSSHQSQCYEMEDRVIKYYPQELKKTQERIGGISEDLKVLTANPIGEDNFKMVIEGITHTDKKTAGEAIVEACAKIQNPEDKVELGTFRGFPMTLFLENRTFKIALKGNISNTAELENNIIGNITRINNALESMPKNIENLQERFARLTTEMESAKDEAARPFPKEEEYQTKTKRLAQLDRELDQTGKEKTTEKSDKAEGNEERPSVLKKLNAIKSEIDSTEKQSPRKDDIAI